MLRVRKESILVSAHELAGAFEDTTDDWILSYQEDCDAAESLGAVLDEAALPLRLFGVLLQGGSQDYQLVITSTIGELEQAIALVEAAFDYQDPTGPEETDVDPQVIGYAQLFFGDSEDIDYHGGWVVAILQGIVRFMKSID